MMRQMIPCGIGADLYVIQRETFKTEFLSVTFTLKPDRKTASAYALVPAILSGGSEAYPTQRDFARKLDILYNAGISARCGKCGESHNLTFRMRCLDRMCVPDKEDLFSETVAVLGEMLLHPLVTEGGFLPAVVEREKKNLCDNIRADINNKAGYAQKQLEKEMFRDEVYSIPVRGTIEGVAAVTAASAYECYSDMLAHAPVVCHYVGKRDVTSVLRALQPLFAELDRLRGTIAALPRTDVLRLSEHPVREITEMLPIRQSRLCIGYRTAHVLSDGDFYKFALFNELLGGSASSKLFLDLREERGLCYDIASFPDAHKGVLYITCGISSEDIVEARAAIDAQIDGIRAGDITDAEFEAAKKSLVSGYREIEDNASALAAWYENRLYAGIATSPAETARQVDACTKEDMMRCAARLTQDTVFFLCGTDLSEEDCDEDTD